MILLFVFNKWNASRDSQLFVFHFHEKLGLIDPSDVYFDILLGDLTRIQSPGLFIKVQPSLVVKSVLLLQTHKQNWFAFTHMQPIATNLFFYWWISIVVIVKYILNLWFKIYSKEIKFICHKRHYWKTLNWINCDVALIVLVSVHLWEMLDSNVFV